MLHYRNVVILPLPHPSLFKDEVEREEWSVKSEA